ncbi:septum formation initiator family protein [Streptomyces sp. NPDC005322]|uniref:FtsB family cell division protein n=1 Tax=Streptomyces sp. NPDC005322 TaxID=3157032 RepID=UPI0033BC5E39
MSGAGGPKGRAPGATTARRAPFVLLVVVVLGSGLIALLLLNSSLNQGSFELGKLEKQTDELTDERQALQQDVDQLSAPGALERRARELGMVPGGSPAFLNPDGTVRGVPAPATGQPSALGAPGPVVPPLLDPTPVSPAVAATPTPSPSPTAGKHKKHKGKHTGKPTATATAASKTPQRSPSASATSTPALSR